jgi:hypothetical protein
VKESDIQRQILDYLAIKGVFAYRNNSGALRRFFRAGVLGGPDVVCGIDGRYIGIEVKAPKGKQSDHQKEFQKNLEAAGGKYVLAYSLDDIMHSIKF